MRIPRAEAPKSREHAPENSSPPHLFVSQMRVSTKSSNERTRAYMPVHITRAYVIACLITGVSMYLQIPRHVSGLQTGQDYS